MTWGWLRTFHCTSQWWIWNFIFSNVLHQEPPPPSYSFRPWASSRLLTVLAPTSLLNLWFEDWWWMQCFLRLSSKHNGHHSRGFCLCFAAIGIFRWCSSKTMWVEKVVHCKDLISCVMHSFQAWSLDGKGRLAKTGIWGHGEMPITHHLET